MRRFGIVLLALMMTVAACGDDDSEPVSFGQGRIPETVPDGFPMPSGATIGATLVDRVNHRTEFTVNAGSDLDGTVAFFAVELVNAGYVVDRSAGGDTEWTLEFSRGSLEGAITFKVIAPGTTSAVVSMNRS